MATNAGGGTTTTSDSKQRVQVFFGNLTKKVKKPGGGSELVTRPYLATCRKSVADKLNLPLATDAQKEREVNGREVEIVGARNGKTIKVPSPLSEKTSKGYLKYYSVQVPSNATKKEIEKFLQGTKAESFVIPGGRRRSVSK